MPRAGIYYFKKLKEYILIQILNASGKKYLNTKYFLENIFKFKYFFTEKKYLNTPCSGDLPTYVSQVKCSP